MIPQVKIHIEPTTHCTRDCSFCRPATLTREYLHPKHHERLIGQLAEMGWDRNVHYSGMGEPTLHPEFVAFAEQTRLMLPDSQITLYTNGDLFTVETLRRLRVIDVIAWDVYADDETAARMGDLVRQSGFPPERFRVVDQVRHPVRKVSRAGALWKSSKARKYWDMPCNYLLDQLCMTADGNWVLCCNEALRRKQWPGHLSPVELNADPDFIKTARALAERRGSLDICRECEIPATNNLWDGKGPARFAPTIQETRFWEWNPS